MYHPGLSLTDGGISFIYATYFRYLAYKLFDLNICNLVILFILCGYSVFIYFYLSIYIYYYYHFNIRLTPAIILLMFVNDKIRCIKVCCCSSFSIEFDRDCDFFAIAGVTKKIKVSQFPLTQFFMTFLQVVSCQPFLMKKWSIFAMCIYVRFGRPECASHSKAVLERVGRMPDCQSREPGHWIPIRLFYCFDAPFHFDV